jgi:hypothetical protein
MVKAACRSRARISSCEASRRPGGRVAMASVMARTVSSSSPRGNPASREYRSTTSTEDHAPSNTSCRASAGSRPTLAAASTSSDVSGGPSSGMSPFMLLGSGRCSKSTVDSRQFLS